MNTAMLEKMKDFFWDRVTPLDRATCWLWQAGRDVKPRKYGSISIYGGAEIGIKSISAHRASWVIHFGEIAAGVQVCHSCDTTLCVNPSHLFLGTQSDNINDCIGKGRFPQLGIYLPDRSRVIQCPSGHQYDQQNTGISIHSDGSRHRYCRACHRDRARARRQAA